MKINVICHYNLPVSSLHTSHGLIHLALVKPHDLQTVIIPILQIKKLRPSENYATESLSFKPCENQVAYHLVWGSGFKSYLSLLLTPTSGSCVSSLQTYPLRMKTPKAGVVVKTVVT